MRLQRANRLLQARRGYRILVHRRGGRAACSDLAMDELNWREARAMFQGVEVGQVIAVRTFDFPLIGQVVAVDDTCLTLKDAVLVLWDGRHGDCWHDGKPPSIAEIEATLPVLHISLDDVRQWGLYPGGKIPKPQ